MNKPPRGDAGVAGTVLARLFPRGRSTRSSTSGDESAPSRIAAAAARGVTALALGVAAFFPGGRPRFLPGVVAARVGVLGGRPRGLPELCGTIDLGGRPRFFPVDAADAELGPTRFWGPTRAALRGGGGGLRDDWGLGGTPALLGFGRTRGLRGGGCAWVGMGRVGWREFAIGVRLESMDF